ncbi:MAG: pantetheine-phosphate adenylyltransferase [Clostridia bacterium]|nr:pantetheine-phosphate adenylyltransferase [Clostridia bacterium]MDD4797984.1 pantetheine-phosphate adenylyltransferase [Clostridia bacterium]
MKIAVYAGTFDPVTNGHLDVARRAARVFDQVIIAVAEDNYKKTMFPLQRRIDMIKKSAEDIPNLETASFAGLLVDYCREVGADSIIRGLRAVSDFEKEFQMALMNRSLCEGIDTVFFMSDPKYLFISSSIIKNSATLGGDVSELVPAVVVEALREKLREGRVFDDTEG